MRKILILGLILAALIFVSGCAVGPGGGNTYQRKYYQGYNSLDIRFLDDSPPTTAYFDSQTGGNEIPIVVEVKNTGAADAYGALYIHGFDPNIVEIAGGKLPGQGHVSFNNGGFTIGNIYIGLSGRSSNILGNIGFISPTGNYYGGSVFLKDGKFVGLNLNVDATSNRIGSRYANSILEALAANFGWSAVINLEGDTPETAGGGLEVYEFPAYVYYLPESLEQFRQPIMVTACYEYATRSTVMMCVDPNPNSNANKACIARNVGVSGGQGGPVAVTYIEQKASRDKVVFTITVKHTRKNKLDDIFDLNTLFYKCNPFGGSIVKPTDKNVVYLAYVGFSDQDITSQCSGGGIIRLDQSGNGQISCTAYLSEADIAASQKPLTIELYYGYGKSIYKEITIKKI